LFSTIFQILTKHAERLRELAPVLPWVENIGQWMTVENKDAIDRIDYLKTVDAEVRFLSL